jgi:hypothetical protein
MNLIELQRALTQLRLGGIAAVLETRLRQAQAESMPPIDLISCLVSDELTRRSDRLLERRRKQAGFRDAHRTLDNFDFTFNPKMNRSLIFDLATAAFIGRREDALFLGPGGTGKSHLAQAIGQAAIQQGYRVLYRETHVLLDELADAVALELRTAAQGLPTAPVQLPQSPLCERCACCRSSGSCHGKCIQKQPKRTGLVSATLHSGGQRGQREPWLNFSGFEGLWRCKPIALTVASG